MDRVRRAFLDATDAAIGLVRSPEVASRWQEPSALEAWTVAGLAGHLVRATTGVESYLDADPDPDGDAISPAAYYATAVDPSDIHSDENRAIRARGDEMAADGHAALVQLHVASAGRLARRLEQEPSGRRIKVFLGLVLTLDDYLATRLVELTCHVDDLAVSVDVPTPELPHDALEIAVSTLVSIGRHRHGDLAVLRSLARRERDRIDALRVL